MNNILSKIILIVLVTILVVIPAHAAKKQVPFSLEQASEYARKDSNGKVLSAKTTIANGEKIHRVQVITSSGRVKIYQLPTTLNKRTKQKGQGTYTRQFNSRKNPNYSNPQPSSSYATPKSNVTPSTGKNKQQ